MSHLTPVAVATIIVCSALTPCHASESLDSGMLDPAWFGGSMEFRDAKGIDYLWVKPGFSIEGRKLRFGPWDEAEFRGEDAPDRDAADHALAAQLTSSLPVTFSRQFKYVLARTLSIVDSTEDVIITGRIVDCSTGSRAAKMIVGMGAGAGSATVDLKFIDAATGEVLVAIHHRVLSLTAHSTTESALLAWANDLAKATGKPGLDRLYANGKRVSE